MGPGTYYLPVIDDKSISTKSKVEKIIFTSGRHYFTLVDERKKRGLTEKIALIRIEEICPFPSKIIHGESSLLRHIIIFEIRNSWSLRNV